MSKDFSTLLANRSSFTPGQKTKIFISGAYDRGSTVPTKTFTTGALSTGVGTAGTITPVVSNGIITDLIISDGGTGLIDGAVVFFTGTGGTGASADLIVVGGVIIGYENLVGGSGYPTSTTTATVEAFTNTTGDVAIGDLEVPITTATTGVLYEGTRIEFVSSGVVSVVYVSQFTPAGVKAIPIEPSRSAFASGSVGTVHSWIPVFSLNQINLDDSATTIAEQVFSAGLYTQKAVTQLDQKATGQGIQVFNDPGLLVLKPAKNAAQQVVVEVVKPLQRGVVRFEAIIAGLPQSIQKNQYIQQTINFEGSGEPIEYNY